MNIRSIARVNTNDFPENLTRPFRVTRRDRFETLVCGKQEGDVYIYVYRTVGNVYQTELSASSSVKRSFSFESGKLNFSINIRRHL